MSTKMTGVKVSTCFLLVSLFLGLHPIITTSSRCPDSQKSSLLSFKTDLIFDSKVSTNLVSWNKSMDCCDWLGVTCDNVGHVTTLYLAFEGISDGITSNSHLKTLKSLKFLNLGYNFLSGNFPESLLTSLPSLEGLNLYNNKLSGRINKYIRVASDNLTDLDLGNNRFQGPLPEFIFKLPSISTLTLSGNNFSGSIHLDVFGKLQKLRELDLSNNRFQGPLPEFIFKLPSISVLTLSRNDFSGSVQLDVFGKLKKLYSLDLSYNNLTVIANTNESSSFTSLANLEILRLASCKMLKVPNLKNLVSLKTLDLSDNILKGEIPNWIWNVGNGSLGSLSLSQNKFSSLQKPYTFPNTLYILDVSSNNLKGDIPVPPGGMFSVNYSNNMFGSSIPTELGDALTFAFKFSISNSRVVGSIPKSINNARFLSFLDLSRNSLVGTIPFNGSTTDLKSLDLSGNKLSGKIPEQLGSSLSLKFLNVSDNLLSGKIPQWGARFTNLSFEGNKGLCGPPLSKIC